MLLLPLDCNSEISMRYFSTMLAVSLQFPETGQQKMKFNVHFERWSENFSFYDHKLFITLENVKHVKLLLSSSTLLLLLLFLLHINMFLFVNSANLFTP